MSFISRPWARLATSEPTLPKPMMPSVLFLTSVPIKSARRHTPDLSVALAWGILRARESMRAMVCSAAEIVLPVGALTTTMPRWVASSTSILSIPTPARAMTCSFLPACITSAETWV